MVAAAHQRLTSKARSTKLSLNDAQQAQGPREAQVLQRHRHVEPVALQEQHSS